MGSHHKKKKGTDDTRIIIADIKKDTDQDATKAALQPAYEGNAYIIPARTMIDFVNVTESIDAAQSGGGGGPPDSIPPAQVTGLTATPASNTQINLNWTANSEPDMDHYDVYRSTINGFTVTLGVTVPVGQPSSNSYPDSGLSASTTYYYKVGAVDFSINRGPVSTQASATTLAGVPLVPSLELHLDSSFSDSSPNNFVIYFNNGNGFILPGAFGTAGWKCDWPTTTTFDNISPENPTNPYPTGLRMDTAIGFSVSFWINPQDLSSLAFRRVLWEYPLDANNKWSVQIEGGTAYFFVKKAGTDYKAQVTGFTTGSWQHVAATFNGSTNTALIYRNAVVGAASVVTPQYPYVPADANGYMMIGARANGSPGTDGDGTNTKFMGYYDEMRWYKSVVLTPTQVTNLKNTNTTT